MDISFTFSEDACWKDLPDGLRREQTQQLLGGLGRDFTHADDEDGFVGDFQLPLIQHRPTGLEFVALFGGEFTMGLSQEEEQAIAQFKPKYDDGMVLLPEWAPEMRPVHTVSVGPFLAARHPLTQAFVQRYIHLSQRQIQIPSYSEHNCALLTREEAITLTTSLDFDLPSEAQWEYLYRANTTTPFYFGSELPAEKVLGQTLMLYDFEDPERNRKAANPFGMLGLAVGEWCKDSYRPYTTASSDDVALVTGPPYVVRGGAALVWPWQGGSEWLFCLSAHRMPSDAMQIDEREIVWAVRPCLRLNL